MLSFILFNEILPNEALLSTSNYDYNLILPLRREFILKEGPPPVEHWLIPHTIVRKICFYGQINYIVWFYKGDMWMFCTFK